GGDSDRSEPLHCQGHPGQLPENSTYDQAQAPGAQRKTESRHPGRAIRSPIAKGPGAKSTQAFGNPLEESDLLPGSGLIHHKHRGSRAR
ncbi:MAG: hypothetical protein EBX52_08860, partial [Proteobacteria bacterium]|nr:hypothetical protein [Pseudomonadota bacterium]